MYWVVILALQTSRMIDWTNITTTKPAQAEFINICNEDKITSQVSGLDISMVEEKCD